MLPRYIPTAAVQLPRQKKTLLASPKTRMRKNFPSLSINSLKKNEILHRSSELSPRVLEQPTSLSLPRSRHANINHFLFFVFSRYVSPLAVQKYSRKSDQEKCRMTKQADVKRGLKMHHNPDIPYGNVRPSTGKLKPKVSCIFPLFLEKNPSKDDDGVFKSGEKGKGRRISHLLCENACPARPSSPTYFPSSARDGALGKERKEEEKEEEASSIVNVQKEKDEEESGENLPFLK